MFPALLSAWTAGASEGPVVVPEYDPSTSLAPLVEAVSPAVVTLKVEARAELPEIPRELLRGLPFDPHELPQVRSGQGSGFFVGPDGELVTNWHVVDGATRITVVFDDGRELPARVVGGDRALDLALLRVEATGVPWLELAGDQDLRVGDWVLAMGDGLGLGSTATLGIVSGKGRAVGMTALSGEFLQTDAAINEGNSGGPLFSLDGRVVGMSTAIIQGANTVGFAIPGSRIAGVLDELRQGKVSRGYLGVSPQALSAEVRRGLGVKSDKGAVVTEVMPDTPAQRAGLQTGDVIVAVEGEAIDDPTDLVQTIAAHPPGEEVTVEVERGERTRRFQVILAERPDRTDLPVLEEAAEPEPRTLEGVGITLAPLPKALAASAGVESGVLVQRVERGGPADGRLEAGDIVLEVDRRPVGRPEEVERALARSAGQVFLLIHRDGGQQFLLLPLPSDR